MPAPEVNAIIRDHLQDIHRRHAGMHHDVKAAYHPPSMETEKHRLGIAATAVDGTQFSLGDDDYAFPMQSICKVFIYGMALEDVGREETLRHVGVEPSGDAFYAYEFDERHNRPFNPMMNAGALVTVSIMKGRDRKEKVARLLDAMRLYAGNPGLEVDEDVLAQELQEYSDRNKGLSYLMRSLGMLEGDVEENLAVYLAGCSTRVTIKDMAAMGATLAHGGVNPLTGQRALERRYVRDVITVMMTCGMYDAAGEWAYDVGIPAKSGVSGGILLAMPRNFGGAIFSPGLDVFGNSIRGMAVCRELSATFGLHVFADPEEDRLVRRP